MPSTILLALAGGVLFYAVRLYVQFNRYLSEAKASGIPYVVVPVFVANRVTLSLAPLIEKVEERLPVNWVFPWLSLVLEFAWKRRYDTFKRLGHDTFLTVSPWRITLYTADAGVVSQITARRNDFQKYLELYGMLKIYGTNVVCEEVRHLVLSSATAYCGS